MLRGNCAWLVGVSPAAKLSDTAPELARAVVIASDALDASDTACRNDPVATSASDELAVSAIDTAYVPANAATLSDADALSDNEPALARALWAASAAAADSATALVPVKMLAIASDAPVVSETAPLTSLATDRAS